MDLQYEVIMAFHSFNGMASVQSSPGAAAESVATVPTATTLPPGQGPDKIRPHLQKMKAFKSIPKNPLANH
jgi:hypothetical protein